MNKWISSIMLVLILASIGLFYGLKYELLFLGGYVYSVFDSLLEEIINAYNIIKFLRRKRNERR
jgi:hypothetical protein